MTGVSLCGCGVNVNQFERAGDDALWVGVRFHMQHILMPRVRAGVRIIEVEQDNSEMLPAWASVRVTAMCMRCVQIFLHTKIPRECGHKFIKEPG